MENFEVLDDVSENFGYAKTLNGKDVIYTKEGVFDAFIDEFEVTAVVQEGCEDYLIPCACALLAKLEKLENSNWNVVEDKDLDAFREEVKNEKPFWKFTDEQKDFFEELGFAQAGPNAYSQDSGLGKSIRRRITVGWDNEDGFEAVLAVNTQIFHVDITAKDKDSAIEAYWKLPKAGELSFRKRLDALIRKAAI